MKSNKVISWISILFLLVFTFASYGGGSGSNAKIIQGMYDAFAQGDVPSVLLHMHPEIEWNEAENFPYADGNPYIGPDAIVEGVFKRIGEEWEYWTLNNINLHETNNNMVIATGYYKAKNKKTQKVLNAQFAHHWTLKDGKVTSFQQYADTYQVMSVIESSNETFHSQVGGAPTIDPVKVEPDKYKVIVENDKVRVLRITYDAGEKSLMHEHPDAVVVFLTDNKVNFTLSNGSVIETSSEAGSVGWAPATEHSPQNVGDKPMEAILIELK